MEYQYSRILKKYPGGLRENLISILQDIQDEYRYLPENAILETGKYLGIPSTEIYGVASFYNQFRFRKPGRFIIQVCNGTSCHLNGSGALLEFLEKEYGMAEGDTSKDGVFTLEVVPCLGACQMSPVVLIEDAYYTMVTPDKLENILNTYRSQQVEKPIT